MKKFKLVNIIKSVNDVTMRAYIGKISLLKLKTHKHKEHSFHSG